MACVVVVHERSYLLSVNEDNIYGYKRFRSRQSLSVAKASGSGKRLIIGANSVRIHNEKLSYINEKSSARKVK